MDKQIKLYSFFIFFLFLVSMELWIGWNGRRSNMLAIFGICALFTKLIYKIPWESSFRNISLCLVFYVGYFLIHPQFGVREFFTQILPQFVPICCIVFPKDEYKENILNYITKWFSLIMMVSIPLYLVTLLIHLPNLGMLDPGSNRYGIFENYIFYVKEIGGFEEGFSRFGGPFLEPGYLGMIGAFLLFVNKFDFSKREVIIILCSIVLTFSLAGWVLAFWGYISIQYYNGKFTLNRIILFSICLYAFISLAQYYNDGNNLINNEILSRLEFDENKGIVGNNRNVETMTVFFQEMWDNKKLVLYGYPESAFWGLADWETIGAGLERFMVFHGLLGVFYVFLFYIVSILYSKDKKYAILFLILIMLCFWQRTYAQWFSWIICFHYATISMDQKKLKLK